MEYKKIESLVYKQNLINRCMFKTHKDYILKLDKMFLDNLQKCIDKNIPLEMNEEEYSKAYKIYLKLKKNKYDLNDDFIFKLAGISSKKLDYLAIIREITE